MCRMCNYYLNIDLRQLPTSNPFATDDVDSPTVGLELPSNIVVESPESQRYVAWQSIQRFPSLRLDSATADKEQSPRPKSFTIYRPYEQPRLPMNNSNTLESPRRIHSPPPTRVVIRRVPVTIGLHKFQERDPVSAKAEVEHVDEDQAHSGFTSEPVSPISDEEEVSYLRAIPTPLHKPQHLPVIASVRGCVPAVLQPGTRHSQIPSTEWMAQACRNLWWPGRDVAGLDVRVMSIEWAFSQTRTSCILYFDLPHILFNSTTNELSFQEYLFARSFSTNLLGIIYHLVR